MLTEQTRYRITGAVFLIATAAVVLPALFDGAGIAPIEVPAPEVPPIDVSAVQDIAVPDVAPTLAARDALRKEIDAEGYRRDTGIRHGEPTLSEAPPAPTAAPAPALPEGWAVQVASFSQSDRAQQLRDRLRGDGFDAFLSDAKVDARRITRVAVGPLDRAAANELKETLSSRYANLGLGEPRVVHFSY